MDRFRIAAGLEGPKAQPTNNDATFLPPMFWDIWWQIALPAMFCGGLAAILAMILSGGFDGSTGNVTGGTF